MKIIIIIFAFDCYMLTRFQIGSSAVLLWSIKKGENHLDCVLSASKNWLCFGYYDNPCKSQINHMFDYILLSVSKPTTRDDSIFVIFIRKNTILFILGF